MGTNDAALPNRLGRDVPADDPTPGTLALPSWQAELKAAVRDPAELERLLELPPGSLGAPAGTAEGRDARGRATQARAGMPEVEQRREQLPGAVAEFPLLVPRGLVARMRKGDANDPLLRQVWPSAAELTPAEGFSADPVREQGLAAHGLIKKYPGRVLLIASGACPLHCRYCFRREFPYQAQIAARADWAPAIAALRGVADAKEAILSGGDPLSLSNRRLGELLARLADTTVTTVRIHTRFPVAIPERVDEGLLRVLRSTRLTTVLVVHTNHANELDAGVERALATVRPALTALLNQSVLLKGVNDDAETLAALSERLFACGVLPYYLHLLDRVAGAAHFDVDEARGKELVAALRARLPGYLVPRLVREIPGELSKTLVA